MGSLARALAGGLLVVPALLAGSVTFYKDIAPIVYRNCAPCHHAGGWGPFSLITYEDVRKHRRQIADATRRRYMPPWLPEPGYGDFADQLGLTDAQIRLLEEWADDGAPAGDEMDATPGPKFIPGWQLGPPDMVVRATRAYAVPPTGRDVFWNFVLTPDVHETRYVRAIEIKPGNPLLVHHANLLIDRARSGRLQEKHPGDGFPGMDLSIETDVDDPDSHFLFWKPGSVPYSEPDGLAWRLDPGDDLILNVHLQPSGKPEGEQPSVGLYFTSTPPTQHPVLIQLEHDGTLDIPSGDSNFLVADDFRLPLDVDVLAVYPHAHYLGKLLEGYATLPSGERVWLVRVPDWDLNWQAVFRYRKPVFLPKGSVISMRYHYDNSEANPRNPNHPPKRVKGGNQSTDEMGHLWLQVLPHGAGDPRLVLEEALMRHRLEKYPADFTAHFNLGGLLMRRNDVPGAIAYLQSALRLEPDHPVALNTLGAAFESQGRYDDAIVQFRHALRVQPDYTNSRYNLANTLAAEGKMVEAVEEFRRVLAANSTDIAAREHLAEALKELGDSLVAEGDFAQAAARYQELVDLQPKDADLRNSLGALYAKSGNLERAIDEFQAALKIDPSHKEARNNLELARAKLNGDHND